VATAIALGASLLTTPAIGAASEPEGSIDSLIVRYSQGARPADVISAATALDDVDVDLNPGAFLGFGYRSIELDETVDVETAAQIARDLAALPGVISAEPNMPIALAQPSVTVSPAATQFSPPWGLDRIDQRTLPLNGRYDYGESTGAGVRVYIVDTGVRGTHNEFAGRIVPGYSPFDATQGLEDCNGHGTHVAGTAAGTTYGVAKAATIVPVRVFNCSNSGTVGDAINGLNWIVGTNPAGTPGVVNMSLTVVNQAGQETTNASLDAAVQATINAGFTVVAAAGNSGIDACNVSPSRVLAGITVNASAQNDARANFSNYGTCTDLFAPGVSIVSSIPSSDTASGQASGTSMAAPHVAGVVARLLQAQPVLTPAQVQTQILADATSMTLSGSLAGDPARMLFAAAVTPPPPPPPPPSPPPAPEPVVPPDPAPAPLPQPVNPGDALVVIDGQTVSSNVSANNAGTGVRVTVTEFSLDVSALNAQGSPRPIAGTTTIEASPGRGISTRGAGFAPNSEVGIYLDPPGAVNAPVVNLGKVGVGADGSFTITASLPSGASLGGHVLQVVGSSTQGTVRAVSLGISVVSEQPVDERTISIKGSRLGRSVVVTGQTSSMIGERVVPLTQLPGQTGHTAGSARPGVRMDGTFVWQRRGGKKIAVIFASEDRNVRSSRIVIAAR
jgi:subtilisin family serine protease